MKNVWIYFMLPFLTSCSYFLQGKLDVLVTSHGKPVNDAQLLLYGKNKEKEIFLGNFFATEGGKIATTVDMSQFQELKLFASSPGIEQILLPKMEEVRVPHWWQEQALHVEIDLPPLPKAEFLAKEIPVPQAKPLVKEETPKPREVVRIEQMESPLADPLPVAEHTNPMQIPKSSPGLAKTIIPPKITKINTITESKIQNLSYKILCEEKPLSQVHVYFGYNFTHVIEKKGQTSENGEIKIQSSRFVKPDVIILQKEGYLTSVLPYLENKNEQPLKLDLKEGFSDDFLIQTYAYGMPRGFDKSQLIFNGNKLEVSSPLGLLSLTKEVSEKDRVTIEQANSSLPPLSYDDMLGVDENNENEFMRVFLPSKFSYKPTVGLLEPALIGTLESHKVWRRARREFFSQFINEQSFKTKITSDLVNLTNLSAGSLEMSFQKGWEKAPFAKDIDIVLQIGLEENGGEDKVFGKIYAKDGNLIFDEKYNLDEKNAEEIAAKLYRKIMEHLPLESYLSFPSQNVMTVSLGKDQHIQKGDLFLAYIPQQKFGLPNQLVGALKVTQVEEKESIVQAVYGKNVLKKNLVVRVVRADKAYIEKYLKSYFAKIPLGIF